MTYDILPSAFLPRLVSQGRLNVGFLLAIALCVVLWIVLNRTSLGYEFRMIGSNPRFSKYVGIAFRPRQVLAMGISGALAGLGGAIEVLGSQHRFIQDISPGWGFDGILVALLAGLDPLAVIPVGLLFGALKGGGLGMEAATDVPSELSQVLLSIIVLLVAAQIGFATLFGWIKQRQAPPGETPDRPAVEESSSAAK
jgi:simple sugar transport system permease protein